MARHQGIYCPTCNAYLPVGEEYHFDADLSLVCNKCQRPIVPTTILSENKLALMPVVQDRKFRSAAPVIPKQALAYQTDGAY